jgi:thiamine biosynthesis lipoprotein
MGTLLQIAARGSDQRAVEAAMEAALNAVDRVDRLMSFHREDSDLTRINRRASHEPLAVDPWTYGVVHRAMRLAALSDGLFDVTIAPWLIERGLLPEPQDGMVHQGDWRDVTLLPECRIFLRRPVLIDLGGIAKGFAVDRAIHALRRGGCTDAIVNAGGDLRAFGTELRPIHLRRRAGLVPMAELRCGAIATSAPYSVASEHRADQIGCIVDPRSREAWHGEGSVMVAARTCAVADALTKVAALAGPKCQPLLVRFGAQAYWDDAF